jgi:hypothetical protein
MGGMRNIILLGLVFTVFNNLNAQTKHTTTTNQVWYGYYPQIRLTKHWGLWSDAELHQKSNFIKDVSQTVFRLAGTYYINDLTKFTAGYTFINYNPDEKHLYVSQPEHGGWQQLQWYTYYRKKKLMQWIRLEERFKRNIINDSTLANDYTYTWRARYNLFYQLPLSSKGIAAHQLSAVIGDELYINFGKHIVNNYFDQNRIFLGFSYMVNSHDNLQFGYTNIFQQLSAGNQYKRLNLIRLSFFENIGLYHKTAPSNIQQ